MPLALEGTEHAIRQEPAAHGQDMAVAMPVLMTGA